MASIRHNPREGSADGAYLDAARATILAVGWRRSTLTEVARRAGVSRMTIYRRWPDMQALLADLMIREWGTLVADRLGSTGTGTGLGRRAIAEAVVACLRAIREDELFRKILDVDPELLLPYLVERRGRTQDLVLHVLADAVAAAQAQTQNHGQPRPRGGVRSGDPLAIASTLLLTLHGFLVSASTMTGPDRPGLDALDAELTHLVERYLAP